MAKPAQQKNLNPILHINLLHPQGEQLKLPGKFISWLFGYGRFIIIAVEIVVIVCFLIRFKLDADLENLNKQIKQEADSIKSHSNDEILIKQIHQELQLIKQVYSTSPDWKDFFAKITKKIPTGVTFTNFSLEHAQTSRTVQFKIVAQTKSSGDISSFLYALRELDKKEGERSFTDISLTNVGLDQGLINFTISGATK